MIFQTVHIPQVYAELPSDPTMHNLYYDAILNVLEDAEENCVILVDTENVIEQSIETALATWPDKNAVSRVRERRKKLAKRLQIVSVPSPLGASSACDCALGIAAMAGEVGLVAPNNCICTGRCSDLCYVRLGEYVRSTFNRRRRAGLRCIKSHNEWSTAEFEAEILAPLFRHAKTIKLFDRYIGRHLAVETPDGALVKNAVEPEWAAGLELILGSFARATARRAVRNALIYCGVRAGRLPPEDLRKAAGLLRDLVGEIGARHSLDVDLSVKAEYKNYAEMRHARFIVVDKLAFEIDRGFDLVIKNSGRMTDRMKDFTISRFEGREKIEAEVRALEDIE